MGPLEIHPGLGYEFIYDDNIFKDSTGEVDDLINKVTPSIGFRLPLAGKRHEINLYSEARFWAFEDRGGENHQDYLGRGDALFRLGNRFELSGKGSFEATQDPSSSEAQSATAARTPRTALLGSGKVLWKISPKTRLSMEGRISQDRYKQRTLDRLENDGAGATFEAFYDFLRKTSILVSYNLDTTDFINRLATDSNDDSVTHNILVGVAFDPTAKLSGRATVGGAIRDFDAAGRDNESTVSVKTDLTWRPLARTTLGLLVEREFADTSTIGETAITRTTGEAKANQALTRKLGVSGSFKTVFDEFVNSPTNREDITYTAKGGLNFELFRWLTIGVNYEYEKKDSDVNVNDYRDNRFIFQIRANL